MVAGRLWKNSKHHRTMGRFTFFPLVSCHLDWVNLEVGMNVDTVLGEDLWLRLGQKRDLAVTAGGL